MRDEQIGDAETLVHVAQEIEHLRLDRNIEGGHGFVEHQHFRIERQCARNVDPLALAAAQLMGIAVGQTLVEPDERQQLLHPFAALRLVSQMMDAQRLLEGRADAHARRKRGIGILEDHLHLAGVVTRLGFAQADDVLGIDRDLS